jgi:hypothetical protein
MLVKSELYVSNNNYRLNGRGMFKILNDEYGGIYTNKLVDASDVIRCKIEI